MIKKVPEIYPEYSAMLENYELRRGFINRYDSVTAVGFPKDGTSRSGELSMPYHFDGEPNDKKFIFSVIYTKFDEVDGKSKCKGGKLEYLLGDGNKTGTNNK